ncbi:hypothetical protein N7475_005290 [Penicillium sp. IBT 31633x]|nr:hypothetical protein N7475_005290 [Penicillium sp. IBT 31633x]
MFKHRFHSFFRNTSKRKTKTYNSEDSLVVTHPTTNSPACGLSTAERTGSPVFHTLWSYVLVSGFRQLLPTSRKQAASEEYGEGRLH